MRATPGPWRFKEEDVDQYTGEYSEPCIVTETDASGIAKTIAVVRIGLEGTNANGHLITAAPLLLEACKRILKDIEADDVTIGAIEDLRAAIEKAGGL